MQSRCIWLRIKKNMNFSGKSQCICSFRGSRLSTE